MQPINTVSMTNRQNQIYNKFHETYFSIYKQHFVNPKEADKWANILAMQTLVYDIDVSNLNDHALKFPSVNMIKTKYATINYYLSENKEDNENIIYERTRHLQHYDNPLVGRALVKMVNLADQYESYLIRKVKELRGRDPTKTEIALMISELVWTPFLEWKADLKAGKQVMDIDHLVSSLQDWREVDKRIPDAFYGATFCSVKSEALYRACKSSGQIYQTMEAMVKKKNPNATVTDIFRIMGTLLGHNVQSFEGEMNRIIMTEFADQKNPFANLTGRLIMKFLFSYLENNNLPQSSLHLFLDTFIQTINRVLTDSSSQKVIDGYFYLQSLTQPEFMSTERYQSKLLVPFYTKLVVSKEPAFHPENYRTEIDALMKDWAHASILETFRRLEGLADKADPEHKHQTFSPFDLYNMTISRLVPKMAKHFGVREADLKAAIRTTEFPTTHKEAAEMLFSKMATYISKTVSIEHDQLLLIHNFTQSLYRDISGQAELFGNEKAILEKTEAKPAEPKVRELVLPETPRTAEMVAKAANTITVETAARPESVIQTMDTMRQQLNKAAIDELFAALEEMVKGNQITNEAYQEIRENWEKGDKKIFGVDVAENRVLFDQQRRGEVIALAVALSAKKELNNALVNFKQKLNQDIERGNVVVGNLAIRQRYPELFTLARKANGHLNEAERKAWEADYRRVVRDALLKQEIRKESNLKQATGYYIENILLHQLGFGSENDPVLKERRNKAELDVLKTLLQGEGLEAKNIELMQEEIAHHKLRSRIAAAGLPKEQVDNCVVMIKKLTGIYLEMHEKAAWHKENVANLPIVFPEIAKKYLLESKSILVDAELEYRMIRFIRTSKKWFLAALSKDTKYILNKLDEKQEKCLEPVKNGKAFEDLDKMLAKDVAFYSQWGTKIVRPMMQGFEDANEVLGGGVCFGISLRWTMAKLNIPRLTAGEYVVKKADRFVQAVYKATGIVSSVFGLKPKKVSGNSDLDLLFPEVLKNQLGIKRVNSYFKLINPDKEGVSFKAAILNPTEPFSKSNGIAFISLFMQKGGGHAITITFDRKHRVFQIGDPNVGDIQLESEDEFFKCFNDLINTHYGELKEVHAIQLVK